MSGERLTSINPRPSFIIGTSDFRPMSVWFANNCKPAQTPIIGFPSLAICFISLDKSSLISPDSRSVPPGIINASSSLLAFLPSTNPFDLTRWVGSSPKFSNPGTAPLY